MARNRYIKVFLTAPVKGNLSGAMVVGNGVEADQAFLLLERQVAVSKTRAKKAVAKKTAAAAASVPATSFPAGATANG
jgi:hypothetical protein